MTEPSVTIASDAAKIDFFLDDPSSTTPIPKAYPIIVEQPCRLIIKAEWSPSADTLAVHVTGLESFIISDAAMVTGASPIEFEYEITPTMIKENGSRWMISVSGYYAHHAKPGLAGSLTVSARAGYITEADETGAPSSDNVCVANNDDELARYVSTAGTRLVVICWYASWEGGALDMDPFVKLMSVNLPTPLYIRADIDHCSGAWERTEAKVGKVIPGNVTFHKGDTCKKVTHGDKGLVKAAILEMQ